MASIIAAICAMRQVGTSALPTSNATHLDVLVFEMKLIYNVLHMTPQPFCWMH